MRISHFVINLAYIIYLVIISIYVNIWIRSHKKTFINFVLLKASDSDEAEEAPGRQCGDCGSWYLRAVAVTGEAVGGRVTGLGHDT